MRKLHMALLGIFASGVLLGGIGTGIAFGEYSGFEYNGRVRLGEDHLVTEELEYMFTPSREERIVLQCCYSGGGTEDSLIVEDASVPVGVIRYKVTYNEQILEPELLGWYIDDIDQDQWEQSWAEAEARARAAGRTVPAGLPEEAGDTTPEETEGGAQEAAKDGISEEERHKVILELGCNYYGDAFAFLMENKDRILNELKEKKIASYEVVDIASVEILVNPDSMLYLDDYTQTPGRIR